MALAEQENPLLEGLQLRRTPDPCALVIFGASGDLTRRKLFPALYSLAFRGLLPEQFGIVGVARTELSRRRVPRADESGRPGVRPRQAPGRRLGRARAGDALPRDRLRGRGRGRRVTAALGELDEQRGTAGNRVYYLAVPPDVVLTLARRIGTHRSRKGWVRLIARSRSAATWRPRAS